MLFQKLLITKQKKVGIGILTADCAPVLFYDKKKINEEDLRNIIYEIKEKKISEDESKNYESEVQKSTDENISLIEKILTEKEKEILTL